MLKPIKKLYLKKKLPNIFPLTFIFCNHCSEIYILDTLLRRYLYFTQVVVGYPAVLRHRSAEKEGARYKIL